MPCKQHSKGQRTSDVSIRLPSPPKPLAGGAGQAHAFCCPKNRVVLLLLIFASRGKHLASSWLSGHLWDIVNEGGKQSLSSQSTQYLSRPVAQSSFILHTPLGQPHGPLPTPVSRHRPVISAACRVDPAAPGVAPDAISASLQPCVWMETLFLWPLFRPKVDSYARCCVAGTGGTHCHPTHPVYCCLKIPLVGEGWGKTPVVTVQKTAL